ncbi:MAG TPA: hypothetical protein VHM02_15140 [Thermoanaerobaculia bacterium]|nr:hypothetical protein [Thermoanaerobaculia bacterium]
MTPLSRDPRQALAFALERYPERVQAVPVREILLDSARQNPRRPAYLQLAVPDDVVKAVRGGGDSDLLLLVQVPREVLERRESRIVLPGEMR